MGTAISSQCLLSSVEEPYKWALKNQTFAHFLGYHWHIIIIRIVTFCLYLLFLLEHWFLTSNTQLMPNTFCMYYGVVNLYSKRCREQVGSFCSCWGSQYVPSLSNCTLRLWQSVIKSCSLFLQTIFYSITHLSDFPPWQREIYNVNLHFQTCLE